MSNKQMTFRWKKKKEQDTITAFMLFYSFIIVIVNPVLTHNVLINDEVIELLSLIECLNATGPVESCVHSQD